eukprot:TRINITY_DN22497_c0_g1_i2.p1 TRINITY_DN22497_c0_g1~~TRINITY_DN22497_c0_g1_i2.p1  ORF type:complete len:130 (+),score=48.22 TRINITY_DN22497_c0_g1_i2:100-489(+)
MKFGQLLREQREAFGTDVMDSVLDYKMLKKRISSLKENTSLTDDDVQAWMACFLKEIQKFDAYYLEEVACLTDDITAIEAAFQKEDTSNKVLSKAFLKDAYLKLKEMELFLELNRTAVGFIACLERAFG